MRNHAVSAVNVKQKYAGGVGAANGTKITPTAKHKHVCFGFVQTIPVLQDYSKCPNDFLAAGASGSPRRGLRDKEPVATDFVSVESSAMLTYKSIGDWTQSHGTACRNRYIRVVSATLKLRKP